VNRPCYEFLPSPAFADNQDRAAGSPCGLDAVIEATHRRVGTHQAVEGGPLFSRYQSCLAFECLNARSSTCRRGPEVRVGEQNHTNVAQLVERRVDLERRGRILGKGRVGTFLVQMKRRHNFRERYVSLAQQFAGSDRIDRIAIHVSVEQVPGVSRKRVVEEVAKLKL
jgi:hypothetical protein